MKSAARVGNHTAYKVFGLYNTRNPIESTKERHVRRYFIRQDDNVQVEKYFSESSQQIHATSISTLNINSVVDLFEDRYRVERNRFSKSKRFSF